jgi:hypothetical protein
MQPYKIYSINSEGRISAQAPRAIFNQAIIDRDPVATHLRARDQMSMGDRLLPWAAALFGIVIPIAFLVFAWISIT